MACAFYLMTNRIEGSEQLGLNDYYGNEGERLIGRERKGRKRDKVRLQNLLILTRKKVLIPFVDPFEFLVFVCGITVSIYSFVRWILVFPICSTYLPPIPPLSTLIPANIFLCISASLIKPLITAVIFIKRLLQYCLWIFSVNTISYELCLV